MTNTLKVSTLLFSLRKSARLKKDVEVTIDEDYGDTIVSYFSVQELKDLGQFLLSTIHCEGLEIL